MSAKIFIETLSNTQKVSGLKLERKEAEAAKAGVASRIDFFERKAKEQAEEVAQRKKENPKRVFSCTNYGFLQILKNQIFLKVLFP